MTSCSHTLVLLACVTLAGCATRGPAPQTAVLPPQTQYDAVLTDSRGTRLSINQLAGELAAADVVVIGEYHGHHGAHLLQSLLQSALYQQRPQQVLTMEQFTLDDQGELDRYLAGDTGESELIADTDAWPNYKASYRPLVEFSRTRGLPVIAANAPADTVRCVGRQGADYMNQLSTAERERFPKNTFVDTPAYREKFFSVMTAGHGSAEFSARMENTYRAQLLRDNTMAAQVINALTRYPGHQVIHLTGTFHAEERLGMVAVLETRRPNLNVVVISPAFWQAGDSLKALARANRSKGDFLYYLQPLPEEYKDQERHREAVMRQFRKAAEVRCD